MAQVTLKYRTERRSSGLALFRARFVLVSAGYVQNYADSDRMMGIWSLFHSHFKFVTVIHAYEYNTNGNHQLYRHHDEVQHV